MGRACSEAHGKCWTLLHEAAHGLAHVRGVRDTSRGGRYHNRRYRKLAQELGLDVQETPPIGWSGTTVSDATAEDYRQLLNELADALILWRRSEQTGTASKSRNLLACCCPCGRRIRVSQRTYEEAPILCVACDEPFRPDDLDT